MSINEKKRVCNLCVKDPFLSKTVDEIGAIGSCSYCFRADVHTLLITDIADEIKNALWDHYQQAPSDDNLDMCRTHPDHEYDNFFLYGSEEINEIIAKEAGLDDVVAEDIRMIMDSTSLSDCYQPGIHHFKKSIASGEWQERWSDFEISIKREFRFFSQKHLEFLDALFGNVNEIKTASGSGVIELSGPEQNTKFLYRARSFQNDNELANALLTPDISFGPPPSAKSSPGRMNAKGISVFYGSTDESVAISELRPPVGSKVVTAKFIINGPEPLRLLNISSFRHITAQRRSIFDPDYIFDLQKSELLKILTDRLSRPIIPDDTDLDYIPTQTLADYCSDRLNLDGLIFPPAQSPSGESAYNIVIFHKAARVKPLMRYPFGTTIQAFPFEYWPGCNLNHYYGSINKTRQKRKAMSNDYSGDKRDINLELELREIKVHKIESVKFQCSSYDVKYHANDLKVLKRKQVASGTDS